MNVRAAALIALVIQFFGLTPTASAADPVPGTLLPAFGEYALDVAYGGPHTLLLALNGRIARLDTATSQLTTVANAPVASLALDQRTGGIWFVGDGASVRRVAPDGSITTVVGDEDETCFTGDCGDGGPASDARIGLYARLDASADGALWIGDGTHLRRVDPDDGTIDTVVDDLPLGDIAAAPDGRVAAVDGRRIVVIEDGELRVLADLSGRRPCQRSEDPCGDGGPLAAARFAGPINVAWSGDDLFVSESSNVVNRIRRIGADGRITNVVGSFEQCQLFGSRQCRLGTPAATTAVGYPADMAMVDGDLFFVDSSYVLRVNAIDRAPEVDPQGYRMVASDGGVFAFGWGGFHGSAGDLRLASPIVAGRSNGAGGYWFVAGDGGVFTFGDAAFHGSAAGHTSSPVVDMARAADSGYWVLERNGAVHAFGAAPFCGHARLLGPFAAIVDSPDGLGYALVAEDGRQYGLCRRPGGAVVDLPTLNAPIVTAHRTASGDGLWMVAADGGVFTQGDARFFGSTGNLRLNSPVIDLVPTPSGLGYWLVAADGGVFTFGDAQFLGSMGAVRLNRPVVAGVAGPVVSG